MSTSGSNTQQSRDKDADGQNKTETEQNVFRIGVKVPPFWPDEPSLWFAQLEGQFVLAGITSDTTKFYHVISNLEYKYVAEVKDVVTNPPAENKFQKLKTELIARLSTSQEQRVRQLLAHEELGDRRPSQFLRHLRNLAGTKMPDEILRSLWANRLPSHIQAIIATQTAANLDDVAQLADKINEVSLQPQVHHVATPPTSELDDLRRQIDELTKQVSSLAASRSRPRSRSRDNFSYRQQRSRSQSTGGSDQCWYHWKFGKDATKCRPPCSYPQGNGKGSQ